MFHNMEYVYCVYKERSFSKAAEKLHISQPSLSATIRKVEEEAGSPIFERKTRPVSLTPFGVAYIQGIEQVWEIEEALYGLVDDLRTLQRGEVAIGGSNLSIPYVIPRKLALFKQMYPHVTLRIVEATTGQAKNMLDGGDLDLLITNRPLDPEAYQRVLCYREQLILAVPEAFSINRRFSAQRLAPEEVESVPLRSVPEERWVSLADFADLPYILLQGSNYLRLCTDMMFQECQIQPEPILEVESSAVAFNFARLGIGATILSNVLTAHVQEGAGLCFYRIRSAYSARDAFLCYRKGRFVTAAMRRIIELLTEEAGPG